MGGLGLCCRSLLLGLPLAAFRLLLLFWSGLLLGGLGLCCRSLLLGLPLAAFRLLLFRSGLLLGAPRAVLPEPAPRPAADGVSAAAALLERPAVRAWLRLLLGLPLAAFRLLLLFWSGLLFGLGLLLGLPLAALRLLLFRFRLLLGLGLLLGLLLAAFPLRLLLFLAVFAFRAVGLRQNDRVLSLVRCVYSAALQRVCAQRRGCHQQAERGPCHDPWLAFHPGILLCMRPVVAETCHVHFGSALSAFASLWGVCRTASCQYRGRRGAIVAGAAQPPQSNA